MKPMHFKESNITYAKDQKPYIPLPVYKFKNNHGIVISYWKASFWDKIRLLATGKIWLSVMTFNGKLQPLKVTAEKPEMVTQPQQPATHT